MVQEGGSGNRKVAALAALMTACMLTACGGGGDSSPTPPAPPPPPAVPADVQDAASHAEMVATYTAAQHRVELTWKDRLSDETGYKVQRKSGSSWVDIAALGAQLGTGTINWGGSLTEDSTLRVVVTVRGFEVPLSLRSQGSQEIHVPTAEPRIEASTGSDNLTDNVLLSVSQSGAGTPWVVQSFSLDGGGALYPYYQGRTDTYLIDTWELVNGPHQVGATITSGDLTVFATRDVTVANSSVRISPGSVIRPFPHSSSVELTVTTSVPNEAPAKVEAWIDDKPLGTILVPNGCTWDVNCMPWGQGAEFGNGSVYHFQFDSTVAGASGTHTFRVKATDPRGVVGERTWQVEILLLPELTISSPAEGAQVSGVLHVQGEMKFDKPVASVNFMLVNASTFETKVLRDFADVPGNSTFDFTYDLAGLPLGNYQLKMNASLGTAEWSAQFVRSIVVK